MNVRRAFLDIGDRQIHYRHAGDGPPLLMLHASPGSARQLVPLIEALAPTRRLIAPDTPGNGDSVALEIATPTIADYAARLPQMLDALGLDRVDVYGSHTGASIAVELALLAPDRVGRVVVDGIGVFPPAQRDELLTHYAQPFVPDLDGSYLLRAFHFCRDQQLFFPWYKRTAAARRPGGLRPASDMHDWLVEVLKATETYPLAYRAAFAWDGLARLPLLRTPALFTAAADDPLVTITRDATALAPISRFAALPRFDAPDFAVRRTQLIEEFLGAAA
jgi:pimeloyl-ACP methyl ester carboxylesterase